MSELHRSNNIKDIEEMIQEEETIIKYKKLRPYLARLFMHALLLIVAIRAYISFLDSTDTYNEFIQELENPVIIDIKKIDSSQNCSSFREGYEELTSAAFPKILKGCRCDKVLFTDDLCKNLTKTSDYQNTTNCLFQDAIISKTLSSSTIIPSQYTSEEILKINKLIVPASQAQPSNNRRILSDQVENGKFKQSLPDKCQCYQDIEESEPFNIELFFKNERICVLKHKSLTTLKYMQSVSDDCSGELACQKYFCRKNSSDICPLVDAWFDNQNRTVFPGNQELFIYNNVRNY